MKKKMEGTLDTYPLGKVTALLAGLIWFYFFSIVLQVNIITSSNVVYSMVDSAVSTL